MFFYSRSLVGSGGGMVNVKGELRLGILWDLWEISGMSFEGFGSFGLSMGRWEGLSS